MNRSRSLFSAARHFVSPRPGASACSSIPGAITRRGTGIGTFEIFQSPARHRGVDIEASTHTHFDHDALHRLDAHVLLDRLIGCYRFGDLAIYGLADKYVVDSSCALYDYKKIHQHFHRVDIEPPNNPRSWDHCLLVVETGGIRIVHWGDNHLTLTGMCFEDRVHCRPLMTGSTHGKQSKTSAAPNGYSVSKNSIN